MSDLQELQWEKIEKYGVTTFEADVIGGWLLPIFDRVDCNPLVSFAWDQWAVCDIVCEHGKVRGTADFLNLTEAISRAIINFNDLHHKDTND